MCTPVGHSLAALSLFYLSGTRPPREDLWRLGGLVLLANLPDFDFIPGILAGDPGRYHHGISHSLGFALVTAVAVYLLLAAGGRARWQVAAMAFLAYGSHLLLDWLTWDPPGRNGQGIPLLWPFSETYYLAPQTLFLRVERHDLLSAETLGNNLAGLALELAVLLPLAWLAAYRWRRTGSPAG